MGERGEGITMQPEHEWQAIARSGDVVAAIKRFCLMTGTPLNEAKTAVEKWLSTNSPPPPVEEKYYRICEKVDSLLRQYSSNLVEAPCYFIHVLSPRESNTSILDHIFVMTSGRDSWVDLAVEVVTEDCPRTWFKPTINEHLASGAKMVWLIDAEDVSVRVATASGPRVIIHDEAILDGGNVLPGFSCKVADLFG